MSVLPDSKRRVALLISLPFHFIVRSFLTLIDLINCLLLIYIARRNNISALCLLFLANLFSRWSWVTR